ncbi:hypothetical protein Acsp05_47330 [Actinokineospora sp. NBRC 105648]|nr:hypothetical protein Acsp05_47330 [Actinokineospora sp. NBRC 105648]
MPHSPCRDTFHCGFINYLEHIRRISATQPKEYSRLAKKCPLVIDARVFVTPAELRGALRLLLEYRQAPAARARPLGGAESGMWEPE